MNSKNKKNNSDNKSEKSDYDGPFNYSYHPHHHLVVVDNTIDTVDHGAVVALTSSSQLSSVDVNEINIEIPTTNLGWNFENDNDNDHDDGNHYDDKLKALMNQKDDRSKAATAEIHNNNNKDEYEYDDEDYSPSRRVSLIITPLSNKVKSKLAETKLTKSSTLVVKRRSIAERMKNEADTSPSSSSIDKKSSV